jgi:hypothetical protein
LALIITITQHYCYPSGREGEREREKEKKMNRVVVDGVSSNDAKNQVVFFVIVMAVVGGGGGGGCGSDVRETG